MHQKRVEFLNKEANFEALFIDSYRILKGIPDVFIIITT